MSKESEGVVMENGVKDEEFNAKLSGVVKEITGQLEKLKIGLAAESVYNEFWHWFCDECIEETKAGKISYSALYGGLLTFLRLLHPFVPFVTEAVWKELGEKGQLMVSEWPK